MKLTSLLVLATSLPFAILAKDELGPIETARKAYPDAFAPGMVAEVDCGGVRCYAFAGEAEQCFSGKYAESEAELFEEATLDAKARFFAVLGKGDPGAVITMGGLRTAYQYTDGAFRRVVCVVPAESVSVSFPPAPQTSPASIGSDPGGEVAKGKARETGDGGKPSAVAKADAEEEDEIPWEMKLRKCRERIRENSKDFALYLRMAHIQAEGGFPAKANRCYERMFVLLAENTSVTDIDKAPLFLEAAEYARDNGKPSDALKRFRLLSKLGLKGYTRQATAEISRLLLHDQ